METQPFKKERPQRVVIPKNYRNMPCPCGSGLKTKKCHGNEALRAEAYQRIWKDVLKGEERNPKHGLVSKRNKITDIDKLKNKRD